MTAAPSPIENLTYDEHFEIVDLPTTGSDSDDGVHNDFEEMEPFQQVVGGRTTYSSNLASLSYGSWTPPTPTRNAFQALSVDTPAPAAPVSGDYRTSSARSVVSYDSAESVTKRICRDIEEVRALFGFRAVSASAVEVPGSPPGLQAVPVSCYTGSFPAWTFDDDEISE